MGEDHRGAVSKGIWIFSTERLQRAEIECEMLHLGAFFCREVP